MYRASQPGSRGWEIIVLAARHGPITLADIARELGLAKTSVRQQIDRLVAEGWLDRSRRHGKPGRPVDVFSLSDQGRQLFTQRADVFLHALLEEVVSAEGEAKLRALITGVGRRLLQRFRQLIGDGPPEERLRRLAELLGDAGALNDVVTSDEGVTLKIHTCPYHGLTDGRRLICEMEREVIGELIGAETQLKHCMADGQPRCELDVTVGPRRPGPATS